MSTPPPLKRSCSIIVIDDSDSDSDSEVAQQFKRPCFAPGEVIVIDDDDDDNDDNNTTPVEPTITTVAPAPAPALLSANAKTLQDIKKNFWHAKHPATFYLTHQFEKFDARKLYHDDEDGDNYYDGLSDEDARMWVNLHHGANLYAYYSNLPLEHEERALVNQYKHDKIRLVRWNESRRVQVLVEILEDVDDALEIHTWCKVPASFRVQMARCYGVNECNVGAWLRFVFGYHERMTPCYARTFIESFVRYDTSFSYQRRLEYVLMKCLTHHDPAVEATFMRFTLRRALQELPWLPIQFKESKREVGIFRKVGFNHDLLLYMFSFLSCCEYNSIKHSYIFW